MRAFACFQCIYTNNLNTEENYHLLKVDINPEPATDQYILLKQKEFIQQILSKRKKI